MESSWKSRSTRTSNFITSSSQLDDDIRFSLEVIKKPRESIDALISQEEKMNKDNAQKDAKLTQVEEEQVKYNAIIDRVRTPPLSHNYSGSNSA
jgi:hypothetical protein